MYLFLLVAIPAAVAGYMFAQPEHERKSFVPPVLCGCIMAVLICAVKAMFIFTEHVWTASFVSGFSMRFLFQWLLPVGALYALFLLVSRDSCGYKLSAFFPLTASFYAVFVPFLVITGEERPSLFLLFAKPVLGVSALQLVSFFLRKLCCGIKAKSALRVVVYALLAFVCLMVPPALETLWYFGSPLFLWLPLCLVFSAAAAASCLSCRKETVNPAFMDM